MPLAKGATPAVPSQTVMTSSLRSNYKVAWVDGTSMPLLPGTWPKRREVFNV